VLHQTPSPIRTPGRCRARRHLSWSTSSIFAISQATQ